ncbi:MAG: hypothetical protein A2X86_01810 [Bdellovibrionales bacterium GWA2_49_15]|nr:MAG: hypothetical protein A2X86_01810 [Bdellovibrionales bacterium GWA2_49_15]
MFRLATCLILCCMLGCTTVHFRSSGQTKTLVGIKQGHYHRAQIVGEKKFFLWGLIPNSHIVWTDHEVIQMGFQSGSNISIREYQTWTNFAFTVLSFGMYIPKNYEITVYGLKAKNDQ